MINKTIVCEANKVLHIFDPTLSFVIINNKLCLEYKEFDYKLHKYMQKTIGVQVSRHSGSLCINYGRLGMGGTMAMAIGQLARWIRNQPRVPVSVWRRWAGDKIRLARDNGDLMLKYLTELGYDDNTSTKCILCGEDKCSDWWSLDNISGPCCYLGRCQNKS